MFYPYVLRCGDGHLYVGSAINLRKRIAQHDAGQVPATAHRLPVSLEYYEACRSEQKVRLREKQLKTGFGRAYLKWRLEWSRTAPASLREALRTGVRTLHRASVYLYVSSRNIWVLSRKSRM